MPRILIGLVLLGLPGFMATRSEAQAVVTTDTVGAPLFPDRTAAENGWLSRFNLDREPLGGRSRAMGGTGMAMPGDAEAHVYNPAAILGMSAIQVAAEFKLYSGHGSALSFPAQLQVTATDYLDASDYRVKPRGASSYNALSFGVPVTLVGNRGAFALTYRRVALTGYGDESRVQLQGALTSNAQATYGEEDLPRNGMDAVTFSAARAIIPQADLGVNFNWEGGTLKRSTSTSIAVLGNVFGSGSSSFTQDVSAFSFDAGTMLHFGSLQLGGSLYLGHDLHFRQGEERITTIPAAPTFDHRLLVIGHPLDHDLGVPTMFSVGSSYRLNPRITFAADFLYRPWGHSWITRTRVEPFIGFADPADPSTYFFTLIPATDTERWNALANAGLISDPSIKEETFWSGLPNTHSLRVGGEYYVKKSAKFDFPVRLGLRLENMPQRNLVIPSVDPSATGDKAYTGAVALYYQSLQTDPGCASGACQAQRDYLKRMAEFNYLNFLGDHPVGTTTITTGFGVRISEWSADLTLERTSFKVERFFLSNFDPLLNPSSSTTFESQTLLNIVFSTTMRF
jgi:hypothetical protein